MGLDQLFFATEKGLETPWGHDDKERILELRKFWPLVGHIHEGSGTASEEGLNLTVSSIVELLQWSSNPSAEYPEKVDGWFDEPESIDAQMEKIALAVPTMLARKAAGLDVWYCESH